MLLKVFEAAENSKTSCEMYLIALYRMIAGNDCRSLQAGDLGGNRKLIWLSVSQTCPYVRIQQYTVSHPFYCQTRARCYMYSIQNIRDAA